MPISPSNAESTSPALEAFLLGQVDFDRVLALQRRLVEQTHERGEGQVTLLLCEHPPIITIGRGGSPGDVAMQSGPVRTRQIEVRWVNRGGGCLVHCPGQLAIYPIVPLRWHGSEKGTGPICAKHPKGRSGKLDLSPFPTSLGDFLGRFQAGIVETLDDLNVPSRTRTGTEEVFAEKCLPNGKSPAKTSSVPVRREWGVWGRTGQLATLGVAVRHWVTYFGAYLNVCTPMGLFRLVESDPVGHSQMSSLVAERCGPVRMTGVRAALVRRLADSFGCDRYHLYTGHPLV